MNRKSLVAAEKIAEGAAVVIDAQQNVFAHTAAEEVRERDSLLIGVTRWDEEATCCICGKVRHKRDELRACLSALRTVQQSPEAVLPPAQATLEEAADRVK